MFPPYTQWLTIVATDKPQQFVFVRLIYYIAITAMYHTAHETQKHTKLARLVATSCITFFISFIQIAYIIVDEAVNNDTDREKERYSRIARINIVSSNIMLQNPPRDINTTSENIIFFFN